MNGGRARIDLEYDLGFDSSGKIHALDLRVFMLGGIIMGGSTVDVFSLAGMIDQVGTPDKLYLHYVWICILSSCLCLPEGSVLTMILVGLLSSAACFSRNLLPACVQ